MAHILAHLFHLHPHVTNVQMTKAFQCKSPDVFLQFNLATKIHGNIFTGNLWYWDLLGKRFLSRFLILILHPLLDVFLEWNDLYWKELSRVLSVSAALTSPLNLPFPIQNSICAIFTTLYFCLLTAAMPETWKWLMNMYSKSFCFTQMPHKEFLVRFSIFSGLLEVQRPLCLYATSPFCWASKHCPTYPSHQASLGQSLKSLLSLALTDWWIFWMFVLSCQRKSLLLKCSISSPPCNL